MLLHDILLPSLQQDGEQIALVHDRQSLTYTQLARQIKYVSAFFLACGIKPGDRIAIYLGKCPQFVISLFAASRIGAIFVPVNSQLKRRQLAHLLNDCQPVVIISTTQRFEYAQNILLNLGSIHTFISIDKPSAQQDNFISVCRDKQKTFWNWRDIPQKTKDTKPTNSTVQDDPVAILYTSGSSGLAKGVLLSHKNLCLGIKSVSHYLKIQNKDIILALLPLNFDYGLNQVTSGLYCGAKVILHTHFFAVSTLKLMRNEAVTLLAGVPNLWAQLAPLASQYPQPSLRLVTNSGGVVAPNLIQQLRQSWSATKIVLMYGLTEAFRSTWLPPGLLAQFPGAIGKPVPYARVWVVNRAKRRLCAPNEPGELVHSGDLVALGYWRDKQQTGEKFQTMGKIIDYHHPAHQGICLPPKGQRAVLSGDWVYQNQQGILYFVRRLSRIIKISGYRISPDEVEQAFLALPHIAQCQVIGVPQVDQEEQIVAFVVPGTKPHKSGKKMEIREMIDKRELRQQVCRELPAYMCPAHIHILSAMPQNINGKTDFEQLYKLAQGLQNKQ